jgi:hypothetical protein
MDELLKTLDESVFTPELTSKIQELYEAKITAIADEHETKLKDIEALAESRIQEVEEKATEYAEMVKETYESKATEYADYVKESLTNDLNDYLAIVVEEFVEENKVAIDESVQSAKVKAILEGFDSLLVTTGVSLSQIVEAQDTTSPTAELETLKVTVNKLIKENASLKTELVEKSKQSVIDTLSIDMSLVQKDKFLKLSEMAVYSGSMDEYTSKLQTIVETVVSTPSVEKPKEKIITENVVPSTVAKTTTDHKRFF